MMGKDREPFIIQSLDSFARQLAEKGYDLQGTAQRDRKEYADKVEEFTQRSLLDIWKKAAPDVNVSKSPPCPRLILAATDFISRYLKMRFTSLYENLWVSKPMNMRDYRVLITEPHASYPHDWRGSFDSDTVTAGVEPMGFSKFRVFIEDTTGLGVRFDEFTPLAYGPRDFAERVYLVNQQWRRNEGNDPTPMQALLLAVENMKTLRFQKVQCPLPGEKID